MQSHSKFKPFKCTECGKGFPNKDNLRYHMVLHNKDLVIQRSRSIYAPNPRTCVVDEPPALQPNECPFCHELFDTRSSMRKHMLKHTDFDELKCPICEKTFTQKGNRNKHMRLHTGMKPYKCDICEKRFGEKYDLKKHMLTHENYLESPLPRTGAESENYLADAGGSGVGKQVSLVIPESLQKILLETAVSSQSIIIKVKASDISQMALEDGRQNLEVKSLEIGGADLDEPLPGLSLDEPLPGSSSENNLMELGTAYSESDTQKPMEKRECDGGQSPGPSNEANLNKALPEITWKVYECDICKHAFMTQCRLDDHRRKHTGEKPHLCYICGKAYQNQSGLLKHLSSHTVDQPNKETQCHVCDKNFKNACTLRYHMRHHTGEKPLICHLCGKPFKWKAGLRAHLNTHKKDK
jgi:KRAB domain-containing zinc finger protein